MICRASPLVEAPSGYASDGARSTSSHAPSSFTSCREMRASAPRRSSWTRPSGSKTSASSPSSNRPCWSRTWKTTHVGRFTGGGASGSGDSGPGRMISSGSLITCRPPTRVTMVPPASARTNASPSSIGPRRASSSTSRLATDERSLRRSRRSICRAWRSDATRKCSNVARCSVVAARTCSACANERRTKILFPSITRWRLRPRTRTAFGRRTNPVYTMAEAVPHGKSTDPIRP